MKRLSHTSIFIICILVLFVSGCAGQESTPLGAFIGGTNGLDIKFLENEPPSSVLDDDSDPFFITLSLENKGEQDIESDDVKITLDGISKAEFQIQSLTKSNDNLVEGKSKERQEQISGGKDEISYEAKYKSDLSADFKATIGANVCYKYATEAISNLCLKKEVSARTREEDACSTDEVKAIESSSAPVQVTKLSQRPLGENKVRIVFEIENKGSGSVYSKDAFSSTCSGDELKRERVYVEVKPIGVDNVNFKCGKLSDKDYGEVRLIEDKVTISCEASTTNLQETAFETPVNVFVEYQYKQRVEKDILVENAI